MTAPHDYQLEARGLAAWLYAEAQVYRKHAPGLVDSIRMLEDAAALLETYQAGLVPVTPHPLMQMELIRWVSVADALPDADETVLVWQTNAEEPWPGYLDGTAWRSADGFWIDHALVTHWAPMPAGPTPAPTLDARHEENAA